MFTNSFKGIFVPEDPEVVGFLAGDGVEIAVLVQIDQFDQIKLNANTSADVLRRPFRPSLFQP